MCMTSKQLPLLIKQVSPWTPRSGLYLLGCGDSVKLLILLKTLNFCSPLFADKKFGNRMGLQTTLWIELLFISGSQPGRFCPQWTAGTLWRYSDYSDWESGVLLASSGWRLEMPSTSYSAQDSVPYLPRKERSGPWYHSTTVETLSCSKGLSSRAHGNHSAEC